MKNIYAIFLMLFFTNIIFSQNLTLISIGTFPVTINPQNAEILKNSIFFNLQDLNDLLNNSYIETETLEKWLNKKIDQINETNTNVVMVKNKPVPPKKLPYISLKTINPQVLKTITTIKKIDFVLLINPQINAKTKEFSLNFQLQDNTGKKVSEANAVIDLTKIEDKNYINKLIKESIITIFNQWNRYYYAQKRNGAITLSLTPNTAVGVVKVLNRNLINGLNQNIPIGRYTVLFTNAGFKTLITNIEITDKPTTLKISLTKSPTTTVEEGAPTFGEIYLEGDLPNARFIILEEGLEGRLPFYKNNIRSGEKTIIFDETADNSLLTIKLYIPPNGTAYEFVKLPRKSYRFKIESLDNDAEVILDREIVGRIQNGTFEYSSSPGLHTLTVLKDGYYPARTNISLEKDTAVNLNIKLTPKKISGYIVTLNYDGALIYENTNYLGITPSIVYINESDNVALKLIATNIGFNNIFTNIRWGWYSLNNIYTELSPLFGDLKIITEPEDATVFIDGNYKGKTIPTGLILYTLNSRTTKIRIEKEGYRTITTNFYISPNIENNLIVKLREAPAKAFITTAPEKGFDIFINDEFMGKSGEGAISMELGKNNIVLKKRGFLNIYTNIDIKEKDNYILSFTTTPGTGEYDIIDSVQLLIEKAKGNIENKDFITAYSNLLICDRIILMSEYKDLPILKENRSIITSLISNIEPDYNLQVFLSMVNTFKGQIDNNILQEKYDIAYSKINETLQIINESTFSSNIQIINIKESILSNFHFINMKRLEPIIRDAQKDAEDKILKEEYDNAINKLQDILSLISNSGSEKENNFVKKAAEIENRIKEVIKTRNIKERSKRLNDALKLSEEIEVFAKTEDYETANKKINDFIEIITSYELTNELKIIEKYAFVKKVKENISNILILKERDRKANEIKSIVEPLIIQSDKLFDKEYYIEAQKQLKEAKKVIEESDLTDHKILEDLKKKIDIKLGIVNQKVAERDAWLPKMARNWNGLSFDFRCSGITTQELSNMNIIGYGRIGLHILPFMGINFGGLYNLTYDNIQTSNTNDKFVRQGGLVGLNLRIPIIAYISLFGEGDIVISDFARITSPLDNFIVTAGFDFKYSWIGIKLYYELGYRNTFTIMYQGGGFGITIWLTEE